MLQAIIIHRQRNYLHKDISISYVNSLLISLKFGNFIHVSLMWYLLERLLFLTFIACVSVCMCIYLYVYVCMYV